MSSSTLGQKTSMSHTYFNVNYYNNYYITSLLFCQEFYKKIFSKFSIKPAFLFLNCKISFVLSSISKRDLSPAYFRLHPSPSKQVEQV